MREVSNREYLEFVEYIRATGDHSRCDAGEPDELLRLDPPSRASVLAVPTLCREEECGLVSARKEGAADRAIDGNTDATYRNRSITHTRHSDKRPWWEVDLGKETTFDRLVVWNRTDNDMADRLRFFRVQVLDSDRQVLFEQLIEEAPAPSRAIVRRAWLEQVASGTDTWRLRPRRRAHPR